MDWIGSKRRMTLHFTPTYSFWLNQVEMWFNIFAREVLRTASGARSTTRLANHGVHQELQ